MDGLKLLLWKNGKIQSRNKLPLLIEILAPVLLAGFGVLLRILVETKDFPEPMEFPPFSIRGNPPPILRNCSTLYYAPSHPLLDSLMRQIHEEFFLKDGLNYTFQGFGTEQELIDSYENKSISDSNVNSISTSPVLAGLIFDSVNTENLQSMESLEKFKYTIKMPSIQRIKEDSSKERLSAIPGWYTEHSYFLNQVSGPRAKKFPEGGFPGYFDEGFLYLQYAVDSTLTKMLLMMQNPNGTEKLRRFEETHIKLERFPHPSSREDQVLNLFQVLMGMISASVLIYSVMCMTRNIIQEKESRLKEFTKIMGLSNWLHWMSWFVQCLIIRAISTILITILLKIKIKEVAPLPHSNPLIIFILYLAGSFPTIGFSFLFSTLFSNVETGATAVGMSWLMTYVTFIPVLYNFMDYETHRFYILSLIFPPVGLSCGQVVVYIREAAGVGVQWENIWTGASTRNTFSVGSSLVVMVANGLIYMTAAFYIELAFPGEFGVPLPWYFPFTKWFWTGKVREMENGQDKDDSLEFEFSPHGPKSLFGKQNEANSKSGVVEDAPPDHFKVGVAISKLTKRFGRKTAVNQLSVNMYENQVTSVLGHNGAGKTTTMSILTGLIRPTSGTAFINSLDIRKDMKHIRKSLGLCPQYNILYENLTVEEHLKFFCKLKGYNRMEMIEDIDRMLQLLNLEDKRHAQAKTLSGGMKRKLCVGIAFSAGSKVVLLDEPTAGMDIEARRSTWDLIQSEKMNRTVLLSTHYMEEADLLGDRILIMCDGQLQCCGSSLFLKEKYGGDYNLVIVKDENEFNITAIRSIIEKIIPTAIFNQDVGTEIKYTLPSSHLSKFSQLFEELEDQNEELGIATYGVSSTTMEEIFLRVGIAAKEQKNHKNKFNWQPVQNLKRSSIKEFSDLNMDYDTLKTNRGLTNSSSTSVATSGFHSMASANLNCTVSPDYYGDQDGLKFRNSGLSLMFQQFRAMLKKKILVTCRSWSLTLLQVVVPMIGMAVCLFVLSFGFGSHKDDPLTIDLNDLNVLKDTRLPLICQSDNILCANLKTFANNKTELTVQELPSGSTTINSFIMEKITTDTVDFFLKTMLAVHVETVDVENTALNASKTQETHITGFFNNQPLHTPPILLNLLSNSLLHHFNISTTIIVVNNPFDVTRVEKLSIGEDAMGPGINIGICSTFSLAFLVAGFLIFPMLEKECKFRHLQVIAGASKTIMWLTNLIVDLIICVVACGGSVLVASLFDYEGYDNPEVLWLMFAISVLFGISGIFISMFLAAACTKPAATYCRVILGVGTLGILTGIFSNFLESPDVLDMAEDAGTIRDILNYIPGYVICYGVMEISRIDLLHKVCPKMNLTQLCQINPEDECCTKYHHSYLSWDAEGIGKKVVSTTVVSVVALFLLILVEINFFEKLKQYLQKSKAHKILMDNFIPMTNVDLDVADENKRINQSNIMILKETDTLVLKNLTKVYSGGFLAVDNLNLGVKPGEIFGLLGINGAGKTTTFKMLTGDIPITSGDAYINAYSVTTELKNAYSQIGYCPQFDACLNELTGRETLTMFAQLKGIPDSKIPELIQNVSESLLFTQFLDKRVGSYSGGNKRKLSTALSMIGEPSLIFLDEPTAGMDPEARRHVWNAISLVRDAGTSVVLTSHLMEECEALCSRLGVMVKGRFKCLGSPQHLKNKLGEGFCIVASIPVSDSVQISDTGPVLVPSANSVVPSTETDKIKRSRVDQVESWDASLRQFHSYLCKKLPGCSLKESHVGYVVYHLHAENMPWSRIFRTMEEAKIMFKLEAYSVGQIDLENVFFNCIQKDL